MKEEKRSSDKVKQLLNLEIFISTLIIIIFLLCVYIASVVNMKEIYKELLIIVGFIIFIIGIAYCLKIEQTVGYYECRKCKNRYIPKYLSVFLAMHIGRTRYMKCPKCNKYSWNKKVLKKGDNND